MYFVGGRGMHATVQVRKSEDNLQEPVFVSLLVGWTGLEAARRSGSRHLYPLSHLASLLAVAQDWLLTIALKSEIGFLMVATQ